jgi:hypothetical protein
VPLATPSSQACLINSVWRGIYNTKAKTEAVRRRGRW